MGQVNNTPYIVKGALVSVFPSVSFPANTSTIFFQYNPQQLTRSLEPAYVNSDIKHLDVYRLQGAPTENINIDIEIDATDQLEQANLTATTLGIYPQLAALEVLIYPAAQHVISNQAKAELGILEIVPDEGPMTLLVWGYKRVVPVRINQVSVTEEAHDAQLNPIRARVALNLRVLSYNDLAMNQRGYYIYLTHQIGKEVMATLNNSGIQSTSNLINLM